MHFYDVTLTAKKPQSEAYPKALKTIGDHLRKRRLDLKFIQKDIARAIGVDTLTVCNWEKNRTSPRLYLMPKVVEFLGYDPLECNASNLGERIKRYRVQNGLSLRRLAKALCIDPSTLNRLEKERVEPKGKLKERLSSLLRNLPR